MRRWQLKRTRKTTRCHSGNGWIKQVTFQTTKRVDKVQYLITTLDWDPALFIRECSRLTMHIFGIECNANAIRLQFHASQLTMPLCAFMDPRSSSIRGTATPIIRACSRSLRTTPAVCLRLPSETKVSRAITVGKCTAGSMYWKSTCARIRVSNLYDVKCATSRSVIQVIWKNTWNCTRRRTLCTNVDIAVGTL